MANQPFATIQTQDSTLNRIQANIQNALKGQGSGSSSSLGSVPTGVCIPYFGPTYVPGTTTPNDPDGFLMCINGRTVNKADYPALYSAIGPATGDAGPNKFYLPQVDGLFPRFTDHGSGNDPNASTRTSENPGSNSGDNVGSLQPFANSLSTVSNAVLTGPGGTGIIAGAAEVRPKNVYFNLLVKT